MNGVIIQNPHHQCDWETRMITNKKIITDNVYYKSYIYTEIISYIIYLLLLVQLQGCKLQIFS